MPDQESESPQTPPRSSGWEMACEGILRTEFGRRPSYALAHAMAKLTSADKTAVSAPVRWWLRIRQRSALAFGVASVIVLGIAAGLWFRREALFGPGVTQVFCTVLEVRDARWAANTHAPKAGDVLSSGPLTLESGVVELGFAGGAKVAVEGPARFSPAGAGTLELSDGVAAAEVPRHARGFKIQTPRATVVDLGTRFGVDATADRASRVDVFDGRVVLHQTRDAQPAGRQRELTRNMAMVVDERGAVAATPLPAGAYPQPERNVFIRPQNCGFDSKLSAVAGGIPTTVGFWSGPAYLLTGIEGDIKPPEGPGMLRFQDPRRPDGSLAPADSEVWHLIDIRQHKELLGSDDVELRSFAWFNRAHDPAGAPAKFGFTIAAFHGLPAEAESLWRRRSQAAVAIVDRELAADNDSKTWEKVEMSMKVPASADFLIVQIRAVRPENAAAGVPAFTGHFADWVDVYLHVPFRGSVVARQ